MCGARAHAQVRSVARGSSVTWDAAVPRGHVELVLVAVLVAEVVELVGLIVQGLDVD